MKNLVKVSVFMAIICNCYLAQSHIINFVNTGSNSYCYNDPKDVSANVVNIYIAKSENAMKDYWSKKGFKNDFFQGLALTNDYFAQAGSYLKKGVAFIPEAGTIASAALTPALQAHEFITKTLPGVFNELFGDFIDERIRNDVGIIIIHKNVPRGNVGFRATLNLSDLHQKFGKELGENPTLWMTVVAKKNKDVDPIKNLQYKERGEILIYNKPFKASDNIGFVVNAGMINTLTGAISPAKGPVFDASGRPVYPVCIASMTENRDRLYAPTGPALRDKDFLKEWVSYMEKEKLPHASSLKAPQMKEDIIMVKKQIDLLETVLKDIK